MQSTEQVIVVLEKYYLLKIIKKIKFHMDGVLGFYLQIML
jgi:hypothetical protein